MTLKEEIIKNKGRISSLEHNICLMKSQLNALKKQNRDFEKRLKEEKQEVGE